MIVHAKPVYNENGSSMDQATHWHDPSPQQWPPMIVEGVYRLKTGSTEESFTMTVDDDGTCDDSEAGGHIRCHQPVGGDPDYLCDSYGGIWNRVAMGSSGAAANCITQANMAFDFEREITIGGDVYCFIKATVQAVRPATTGLRGKVVEDPVSCPGDNATWDTTRNANSFADFTCAQYDETRPDNSNVRLNIDLEYYYR